MKVTYLGDERPVVRAAGIVDRINAQTARNAAAQDRIVERSKKTLADVQMREAKRGADAFIRELERTRRAERQSSGGGGGVGSELSTLTGGRLAFAGGGAVAGIGAIAVGFGAAAKAGIEYKETLDRLTKSFEGLLGSQQAAVQHMQEMREFAARTPFEFEDVARASQRFVAMGLNAKDTIPYLTAIGNAVAKVGGGKEQIDSVSLAIAQVSARGKVSAQEMNQLANALVDGWGPLEAELGKTRGELFKMAEAGEISAETFLRAFRRAHEGGNAMQRQMETLTGASSTLKDAGRDLLAYAFTPMHAALRDITVELAKMTTEGWNSERALRAMGATMRSILDTGNTGLLDKWLMLQGALAAGPAGASGMATLLGLGQKPGAAPAQGINIPEQFKYKPRISDEELNKLRDQEFGRQKDAFTADIFRKQEEAQRRAEDAMRKAAAAAEQQASTVSALRERLRDLTIQAQTFNASEVEQEVALMRAQVAGEKLTGEYRAQATMLAGLIAVQMRHLDVQKQIKEEEEREKKQAQDRAAFQERLVEYVQAYGEEQRRVNELIKDGVALGALSVWEAKMLDILVRARELKETLNVNSFLQPGTPTTGMSGPQGGTPLDLSNVQIDYWKTYKESWHESLQYMREDGVAIFGDMFARIGGDWKGATTGLVMDFANALNQMASQAAASLVWGMISRTLGGVLGGTFGGGGALPAANVGGGVWSGVKFAGNFASGGYIPPGQWGMTGERGPEPVFGGRTGVTVTPNAGVTHVTNIYYQPRVTPNSVTSRRSSRETFEALLGIVR